MRSVTVVMLGLMACVSLSVGCGPSTGSSVVDQTNVKPDPNVDPNTANGEGYKDPLAAEK